MGQRRVLVQVGVGRAEGDVRPRDQGRRAIDAGWGEEYDGVNPGLSEGSLSLGKIAKIAKCRVRVCPVPASRRQDNQMRDARLPSTGAKAPRCQGAMQSCEVAVLLWPCSRFGAAIGLMAMG